MTVTETHRTTNADGSRYYVHPVTGEQLISVTTVLGATHGKPYLTPWSAKLAAEYAVDNLAEISALKAEKGRDEAVALVKCQAELNRNIKRDVGTYVHDVVEALLLWAASPERTGTDIALPDLPEHLEDAAFDGLPLDAVADAMVSGFLAFVATFNPVFEVAEMPTFNRGLKVAGTLDSILHLAGMALTPDGTLIGGPGSLTVCLDVKTGKYLDATVQEQLAAYRRMTEAMPLDRIVPMPATDAAAVLHLRHEHPDGFRFMPLAPADDARAWNRFRRAVEIARGREEIGSKPGKVAHPPLPDGSSAPVNLADLDGDGYGRVPGTLIAAGLTHVSEIAAWTERDLRFVSGIGPKSIDTIRRMLADHNLTLSGETVAEVA